MEKFEIKTNNRKKDTITRTIRMSGSVFDKLNEISEQKNISVNDIVNQCIEFALSNLKEEQ